jgi:hypothetical protein
MSTWISLLSVLLEDLLTSKSFHICLFLYHY